MVTPPSPSPPMRPDDAKWVHALTPYCGGGIVPVWLLVDGSVDAQKTVDAFMRARGLKKLGDNGEELEWPPDES
jgi:hypothetical protein